SSDVCSSDLSDFMAKESRVEHLKEELRNLKMWDGLVALDNMISYMNADKGYKRKDGSHYYYHLVDSTQDLINNGIRDESTRVACLLHDVLEDVGWASLERVDVNCGKEVAERADLVTKKEGVKNHDEGNLK